MPKIKGEKYKLIAGIGSRILLTGSILLLVLAGCTRDEVIHSDIRALKAQVSRLEADLIETRASQNSIGSVSESIVQLAEQSKRSIVEIRTDLNSHHKHGAGFIFNDDGIILTNDHLVRIDIRQQSGEIKTYYAETVDVKLFDGRQKKARLIGVDPSTDLAALKIDIKDLPKPLVLSKRKVQQGELAFCIGHPLNQPFSLEWRPVSAVYRSGKLSGTTVHQVDRGFTEGNSGGPLFDLDGKVIGMIFSTINFIDPNQEDKTIIYAAIGWAIPSETMIDTAPELIHGKYFISEFKPGD